ncbi:hypothetical protein FIBSPDRAFT_539467 [Athelia psychrophila]|uniref:Uncharacterized protein n=1 Tax=Athelia psychrophila TaxID=1759441 RepID=A0A166J352_9AGAM|nr:hypothetical protein FIBSPDRAFT_539467 [Fibularhizoctonia sp. CBS 109695]
MMYLRDAEGYGFGGQATVLHGQRVAEWIRGVGGGEAAIESWRISAYLCHHGRLPVSGFWIAPPRRFSFLFLLDIILNIQGIPEAITAILTIGSEPQDAADFLLALLHSISTSAVPDAAPSPKSGAHAPVPIHCPGHNSTAASRIRPARRRRRCSVTMKVSTRPS